MQNPAFSLAIALAKLVTIAEFTRQSQENYFVEDLDDAIESLRKVFVLLDK